MVRFGNISLLIYQCNDRAKRIIDAEKIQEAERLLRESLQCAIESDRQLKFSDEYALRAITIIKNEGIDFEELIKKVKIEVIREYEL